MSDPKEATAAGGVDFGEVVIPIGRNILLRKDEDKKVTSGGIHLPDGSERPQITCRVLQISAAVENDDELPIKQYDKVLVNPQRCIPVEVDPDNSLFILPVDDVVAVIRKDMPTDEEEEVSQ